MHDIYCTLSCMNLQLYHYQNCGSGYSVLMFLHVAFKTQTRRILLHSWATESGKDYIPTNHINTFPASNMTVTDLWQMHVSALDFVALPYFRVGMLIFYIAVQWTFFFLFFSENKNIKVWWFKKSFIKSAYCMKYIALAKLRKNTIPPQFSC